MIRTPTFYLISIFLKIVKILLEIKYSNFFCIIYRNLEIFLKCEIEGLFKERKMTQMINVFFKRS